MAKLTEEICIRNQSGHTIFLQPSDSTETVKRRGGKEGQRPVTYARITIANGQARVLSGAYVSMAKQLVAVNGKIFEVNPETMKPFAKEPTRPSRSAESKQAAANKKAIEKASGKKAEPEPAPEAVVPSE